MVQIFLNATIVFSPTFQLLTDVKEPKLWDNNEHKAIFIIQSKCDELYQNKGRHLEHNYFIQFQIINFEKIRFHDCIHKQN